MNTSTFHQRLLVVMASLALSISAIVSIFAGSGPAADPQSISPPPTLNDAKWMVVQTQDPQNGTRSFVGGSHYVQWYFCSATRVLTQKVVDYGCASVVSFFNYRTSESTLQICHMDGSLFLEATLTFGTDVGGAVTVSLSRVAPPPTALRVPAHPNAMERRDENGNVVAVYDYPAVEVFEPTSVLLRQE